MIIGRRAHGHRPRCVRRAPPGGRRDRHAGRQAGRRHARVRGRAARPRRAHHRLPGEAGARGGALASSATAASTCSSRRSSTTSRDATVRGLGPGRVPGAARARRPLLRPRDPRVLERRRLAGGAAPGHLRRARAASCASALGRARAGPGRAGGGAAPQLPADTELEGPAWIGRDVRIGAGRAPDGPGGRSAAAPRRRRRAAATRASCSRHRARRGSIAIDASSATRHPPEPAHAGIARPSARASAQALLRRRLAALLRRARTPPAPGRKARPARSPSRATARRP